MIAVGSIVALVLGIWIGWRGSLAGVAAGSLVTIAIAVLDYLVLHPEGFNGALPEWPWGAIALIAYTLGLAAGLIASLAR